MGFVLDIFGAGPATKAAKRQAAATEESARLTAQSDRWTAQAAQSTTETMLAQQKAAQRAAELLDKPLSKIDVKLGSDTDAPSIDPDTNRRRTVRSRYTPRAKASGINI